MTTIREKRLAYEFKQMLPLRREGGLIDFRCAELSTEEASAFLASSTNLEFVFEKLQGFVTPEEFQQLFPGKAPEKYLIAFRCNGLRKPSETDEPEEIDEQAMEVVFGYDYPSVPPRYVWLTHIWHPNINPPYLCTTGRPFAISTSLDQICLMVGQMIQYRNYNIEDPLNKEAAQWAAQNKHRFPIDTRDLITGQKHSSPLVSLVDDVSVDLVTGKPDQSEEKNASGNSLVEII